MQIAHLVHALVALLYIAAMVFHVYMGTVGEEGAFEGMWDGTVDEEWAKQHHSVWHEREVAKGNIADAAAAGRQSAAGRIVIGSDRVQGCPRRCRGTRRLRSGRRATLPYPHLIGHAVMKHIERHHSRHTPAQLFDLVVDVEQYPNFVPWVISARLSAARQDDVGGDDDGNKLSSQAIYNEGLAG